MDIRSPNSISLIGETLYKRHFYMHSDQKKALYKFRPVDSSPSSGFL